MLFRSVENATALATHAMRGAVFETWVIAEVLKHRLNQGLSPDIYFWRDSHGVEIDLLFEHNNLMHAVEIKSGTTFSHDWLKGCQKFQRYAASRYGQSTVVYAGENSFETQAINVKSWLGFS